MAFYESTFIARQDLSPQEVEKISEYFTKIVGEHNGKILKNEYWGLRNLAYKIKKNRKGHYVLLGVEGSVDTVNELNRQFKLHEDVIRSLTIRVDEIDQEPSVILTNNAPVERKRSEA